MVALIMVAMTWPATPVAPTDATLAAMGAAAQAADPQINLPYVVRGARTVGSGVLNPDNVARMTELATWGQGNAWFARWAPDGRQICIITSTGLTIFDTETGAERLQHVGYVADARFTADSTGLMMLTANATGSGVSIERLSVAEGRITATVNLPDRFDDATEGLIALDAGVVVISRGPASVLDLYNLTDGTRSGRINLSVEPYLDMALDPAGKWVATVQGDDAGRVYGRVYGLPGGELLVSIQDVPTFGRPVLSPDGALLAVVTDVVSDTSVRIWRLASGELLHRIEASGGLDAAEFSPDGSRIAIAGVDLTGDPWLPYSMVWRVADGTLAGRWSADPGAARDGLLSDHQDVAFSPAGDALAIVSSGEWSASIWEPGSPEASRALGRFAGAVRSLQFDAAGAILAASERDASVRLARPDGKLESQRELGRSSAGLLAGGPFVSPDGRHFFTGMLTETIHVRRIDDGSTAFTIAQPPDSLVTAGSWTPDGASIVLALSTAEGPLLAFHRATDGTRVRTLPLAYEAKRLRWSPDGQTVAAVQGANFWDAIGYGLELIHVPSATSRVLMGKGASDPRPFDVGGIAFTADGKVIAAARHAVALGPNEPGRSTIALWQVSGDAPAREFPVPVTVFRPAMYALAASPDGELLASVGLFGPAYVWSATTGELLSTTPASLGTVAPTGLAFTPDGHYLLWADRAGGVHLYGLR
jgi:WD40 repeat protein